jgi:U3 small nucleolar RNA-associated protein 14
LQIDDLLAPLASSASLQALRKSTKVLTQGDALAVPLPQRTQDRLDREAAYEQTKGEVDKWKATMKRIKEVHPTASSLLRYPSFVVQADHLSFPLQVPQKVHPSNSQLAAKFKVRMSRDESVEAPETADIIAIYRTRERSR